MPGRSLRSGKELPDSSSSKPKNADKKKPATGGKTDKASTEETNGDTAMGDDEGKKMTVVVPPQRGIKNGTSLVERAVQQFDARFTLRALRCIPSIRKHLTRDLLAQLIRDSLTAADPLSRSLLASLEMDAPPMDVDEKESKNVLPEIAIYLAILVQVHLLDEKTFKQGAHVSDAIIKYLRSQNRRTLDVLGARVYFYYSLFHERSSGSNAIVRSALLTALRTAVLRKDQDTQATAITLLLRNYLLTAEIKQADLLTSHTQFPQNAPNNQVARYLYYLGRIRAVQLSYTEAHEHLTGATRKSPSTKSADGFSQAATKLLIVVELLMGDIPDRAVFRQPAMEQALQPYLALVQAVRIGKLEGFLSVVQEHQTLFRRDNTYTLILRLRQNVIKTGIRMMSLSYGRISLRDICMKLELESEQSAEYIVAKAIRDGVIEASLDHEGAYMQSKELGDVYATREPGDVFHERIRACLALHDESVQAMRFPMNPHRLELKNAQDAREREREIAKEIVNGELDDEDGPGGDFEGM